MCTSLTELRATEQIIYHLEAVECEITQLGGKPELFGDALFRYPPSKSLLYALEGQFGQGKWGATLLNLFRSCTTSPHTQALNRQPGTAQNKKPSWEA
jgi:hypothetical protein